MSYYNGEAPTTSVCSVGFMDLCIFEGTDNVFYFSFVDSDGNSMDMSDYTGEARIITSDGISTNFTLTHVVGSDDTLRLTVPYTTDFSTSSGAWYLNLIGPLTGDSAVTRKMIGNVFIIEDNLGIAPPDYLLGVGSSGAVLGTDNNEAIRVIM
jgi:hypothetical protein